MSVRTTGRARPVHELYTSVEAVVSAHDVVMLDLDGVVYVGRHAVPHAPEVLEEVRRGGVGLAYITNNASRTPEQVAAHLVDLGVPATSADVVTSAQAVARLVAGAVPPGSSILVVGAASLAEALAEYGLTAVSSAEENPAAVVQGFDPAMTWALLAEGAYAVQHGTPWFASNVDRTIPTGRGIAPGNGTFVAAVGETTTSSPVVAGKPEPALFDETALRVGGDTPIVVGDRLDTDIEGANGIGAPSLAVLTGVSGIAELATAEPMLRPTYVGPDLRALTRPQPAVERDGDWSVCDGVAVRASDGALQIDARPSTASDGYAAAVAGLRAALAASWRSAADTDLADVTAVTAFVEEHMR